MTDDNSLEQAASAAMQVMAKEHKALLSTFSKKYPDFPFGSMVPYVIDETGCPVVLISRLAQHTQNITDNSHVSFLVVEGQATDAQQDARLTLLGNAEPVVEAVDALASVYYRQFPQAEGYHTVLDFSFYRIVPKHVRWIGGFGQARWLSASAVLRAVD